MSLTGKRIVFVIPSLEMGGAQRQALHLAEHLSKREAAIVQVWGLSRPGLAARQCEELGIPWRIMPFRWPCRKSTLARTLPKFAWHLRLTRPDVLLPYSPPANTVCGLLWQASGAQLCIWGQRGTIWDRPITKSELLAARLTPWFVSNSGHDSDYLCRIIKAPKERIRIIRNGIRLPSVIHDRKKWLKRLAVTEESFVLCKLATFSTQKDHPTILKAWRLVVDHFGNSDFSGILVLAGYFKQTYEKVKSIVKQLRLEPHVRLLESIEDITGLLQVTDIGVLSTNAEGLPNSVLEYMAAGLPVVATDISGVREAVGPDGYRLLSPRRDVRTMADHIIELIENQRLRLMLGDSSRQRIQKEFSIQTMLSRSTNLILEALERRNS